MCVEHSEIGTDREGECYLYQLLLILRSLKATRWFSAKCLPVTIAAAWRKPTNGEEITVAFACACVGKDRTEMYKVRKQYVNALTSLVGNVPPQTRCSRSVKQRTGKLS